MYQNVSPLCFHLITLFLHLPIHHNYPERCQKVFEGQKVLKVRRSEGFWRSEGFEGQKVLKVRRVWILSHTDKRMVLYLDSASVPLWFVSIWVMISLISARGDSMHHCDALSEPRLCNYVQWDFFKYILFHLLDNWFIYLPTQQFGLSCMCTTIELIQLCGLYKAKRSWQGGSPTAVFPYRQASFKWQLVHELHVLTEQQQIGPFCAQFHHCNNTLLNTCLCTFIIIEKWNTKPLL